MSEGALGTAPTEHSAQASQPSPLFIVGAPRSGTTLMARIMEGHPQVAAPGETHFFEEIWGGETRGSTLAHDELQTMAARLYHSVGAHGRQKAQRWLERQFSQEDLLAAAHELGGDAVDLFRGYLRLVARAADAQLVCDDSPRHLFRLDTIFNLLPEARALIVVRDPRGFLASYKHYWRFASPGQRDRIRRSYHPIVTSIYWRSAAARAKDLSRRWPAERVLLLRYEDLVREPEARIKEVCRQLGLSFHPAMVKVAEHNSSFQAQQEGIFQDSIARWRQHLSAQEVWLAQSICAGAMAELGYQPAGIRPNWPRTLGLFFSAPWVVLQIFWSARGRTTSVPRLLWDRLQGLLRR